MHLNNEEKKRLLFSINQNDLKKELSRLIDKHKMQAPNTIVFGENGSYSNGANFESFMFSNTTKTLVGYTLDYRHLIVAYIAEEKFLWKPITDLLRAQMLDEFKKIEKNCIKLDFNKADFLLSSVASNFRNVYGVKQNLYFYLLVDEEIEVFKFTMEDIDKYEHSI